MLSMESSINMNFAEDGAILAHLATVNETKENAIQPNPSVE